MLMGVQAACGKFTPEFINRIDKIAVSNLIATEQVGAGDWIQLDFDSEAPARAFVKISQDLTLETMMSMIESGAGSQLPAAQAA